MLKDRIASVLKQAAVDAQQQGLIPPVTLPEVTVEHPQNPAHGDYACSLPLKIARAARMSPMDIAKAMANLMAPIPEIGTIDVAAPGFINLTLKNSWIKQQVELMIEMGDDYGSISLGQGSRVQVEFVSVNPTGPLHMGHGRGAVLGSTMASILSAAGYQVEREYYLNDAGVQIDVFRHSLVAYYRQALGLPGEVPPDGYLGDYMIDLAREIVAEYSDRFADLSHEEAAIQLGQIGFDKMVEAIKQDLALLGVEFDTWFSEKSLYQGSQYEDTMSLLNQNGYIAEREGATWFASSALGEDKDNVLIRSNGTPTYFASDIAYHRNKFCERRFDRVIDIWGADHQGHVPRMKAAMSALGIDPDRLEIIITQMVTLKRGGEEVRISKRSGDIVTLNEVIAEVGRDACRYFFLARSADSQMEFDLELAKKQSTENPVYYIQYAHARAASIFRLAEEKCIDYSSGDITLLTAEQELVLIRKMLEFPEIIEVAANSLEPNFLPYYAQDLATAFHNFYEKCRVVSGDEGLTMARLKLVRATKTLLARTLRLMGMAAPEKM
ncbi:MAG: arginine--tRNA ligase [Chloroflexota bacterium]|nr:arginine--tRNA ligase [Chloroflexota bacterium]